MINTSQPVRHARDSAGRPPTPGVVKQLSKLARELQAEPDAASLLHHVVAATVREIDGADYGGISLVEHRRVRAIAATNPLVERMDLAQVSLDQGPCLLALREQITIRSDDFESETRWPDFVLAAQPEGIRSMLSVQLFVEGDNLGALNLYACSPYVFDLHAEYLAMALAAHAAVAMKGSRIEANMRTALDSRDLIGQAKGVLMERYKIGADEAFGLLVLSSQRSDHKLREDAEELTQTGELRVH